MLASLLSTPIIGAILKPIVGGLLDAYKAKLDAGTSREAIAADLAQRELAVQQTEIQAQAQLKVAQIGAWYEPEKLFAYIIVIYFGKIVLWDKVLAHWTGGSTDPLTGAAAEWAGLIMAFYFGKRGIENVARILRR